MAVTVGAIKVTGRIAIKNGTFELGQTGNAQLLVDQLIPGGGVPGKQTATVAGINVDLSALTTEGWVRIQNEDPINFVEWGPDVVAVFHPIGKLKPGEFALFRLSPGKTLHLKANSADCIVSVLVNED